MNDEENKTQNTNEEIEETDSDSTQTQPTDDSSDDNQPQASTTQSSQDDQLVTLETQLSDEKNRRLSLMADFENYKKRMESEKALFGAMANMSLIREILEVFDDIGLALNDESLNVDNAKASLKSTKEKLAMITKMAGVEAIEINVGDDFDKEKMEAIQAIPDENNKNKVVAVISSAYKYTNKDGILKAAKVIVGK